MKRSVKISLWIPIILFFIVSSLIFILFITPFWKIPLLNILNNSFFNNRNLEMKTSEINGNLFSNLAFSDVELVTLRDNPVLTAKTINLSYKINTLFSSKPEILGVEIDGCKISYPYSIDSLTAAFQSKNDDLEKNGTAATVKTPKEWAFDFGITNLEYRHKDRPYDIKSLFGHFNFFDKKLSIEIDTANVSLSKEMAQFNISNALLTNNHEGFFIDSLAINNYKASIYSEMDFPANSANQITFHAYNIEPNNYLPKFKKEFGERDYLDATLTISLGKVTTYKGNFSGRLRDNSVETGNFSATQSDDLFQVKNFEFNSNDETLKMNFISGDQTQTTGELQLKNIDLKKWQVLNTETLLSGVTNFRIKGPLRKPTSLFANIDFQENAVDTLNINQIEGEIVYQDNVLNILTPLRCQLENNLLVISGKSDFNNQLLDLHCEINSQDIGIFSPLIHRPELSGAIIGNIMVTGDIKNPDINGSLTANGIGIPELFFDHSQLKFGLNNLAKNRAGNLVMHAKNGRSTLVDAPFPLMNLDMTFKKDTTVIKSLEVVGDIFELKMDGNIIAFQKITVNNISGKLKNSSFYNITPLKFYLQDDFIEIKKSELAVNDSRLRLDGKVKNNQLTGANINLEQFDLAAVNDFIPEQDHLKGIFSGRLVYNTKQDSQKIDVALEGSKILYRGDYFEDMSCNLHLENNRINVSNISIADSSRGFFDAKGYFTCNFPPEPGQEFIDTTSQIDMMLDFNNFDLSILNTYILNNTKLGGNLLGDFKLTNTINSPDIEASFFILQPVFDKVTANSLRLKATINNSNLDVENIYLTDGAGSYYGEGEIPLDIALLNRTFTLRKNDAIDMDFYSEVNSIPALPSYIDDIQALKGNIILNLKFRGTASQPETRGQFSISDGELKLSALENSIYKLNGAGKINDNIITIDDIQGVMRNREVARLKSGVANIFEKIFTRQILRPDDPNINIAGTVDFNHFPKPELDINLEGEDLYIRTLLGEQEGITDAQISVTGKDSVKVDGDIIMKNFIVRNELTRTGETYKEESNSAVHTDINLHIVSPGDFYIRNSQLDCELEGEGWIFKSGSEPFRLSGDFTILEGSLYYMQWEFENLTGNILFRPTELTPTMNIQAELDITGIQQQTRNQAIGGATEEQQELVTVYLTGDFEKPDLRFESKSNISQSDILRILTMTYDSSEEGLKENAQDIVGSFLQRQFERQVSKISPLDEFQLRTKGDLWDIDENKIGLMMGRRITNNLYFTYEYGDYDAYDRFDPKSSYGLRYRIDRKKSISGQIDNDGLFRIKYRFRHHY